MKKRILIPETDLSVYPLGFGTVDAGIKWDGEKADQIIGSYLELGGNVIDTAHVYSDWIPPERCRSERVIGDWLARSGKRNEIVLMTKGGHPETVGPGADNHISRMTREDMVGDLDGSLLKLRTDHIDVYFYHRDDLRILVEETIEVMQDFVRQGKIRYYACSNWSAERMRQARAYCQEKGYRGFVADQSLFNLGMKYMNPMADDTLGYTNDEEYQYHAEHTEHLLIPYTGNCSGFFQKYAKGGEAAVQENPYYTRKNVEAAKRVAAIAEKYHCSVTQVVLGFFFHQPFICMPLFAASSPEHVRDCCQTIEVPFTDEDYKWILDIK